MRFIKTFAVVAVLFGSANAHASDAAPGYVSSVFAMGNGVVMFSSPGARSARPACQGASVPQRWAINATTPAGQAKVALLLTAYSLRRQIQIVGTGGCDDWGDSESVNFFLTAGDG